MEVSVEIRLALIKFNNSYRQTDRLVPLKITDSRKFSKQK
jgi:hypothetical protein